MEKQEIAVPHLLLQKRNNKLPRNKTLFSESYCPQQGHAGLRLRCFELLFAEQSSRRRAGLWPPEASGTLILASRSVSRVRKVSWVLVTPRPEADLETGSAVVTD